MNPNWKLERKLIRNCDDYVYELKDDDVKEYLRTKIVRLWGVSNRNRFPAPQPVSMERKDLQNLLRKNYVVTAKADGDRYLLYCTLAPVDMDTDEKHRKLIKVCFLVDRCFRFFVVTQNFLHNDCYIKDTLVDGELCNGELIIHDSMVLSGNNVMKEKWESRWKQTDSFLQLSWFPLERCSFYIRLKKFYKVWGIEDLFNEIDQGHFVCDGLVFYPMDEEVKSGTQYSLYKWKEQSKHTIDFVVKNKDYSDELFVETNKGKTKFSETNSILFNGKRINPGSIIEYGYKDKIFVPLRLREDKDRANSRYTATKTMLNITENITKGDLLSLFKASDKPPPLVI